MARKHKIQRPRSKADLLPLPASVVRDISLENHLALATMRGGYGTAQAMITLLRVLYLAYFAMGPDATEEERTLFLTVELALQQSIDAAGNGQDWQVSDTALESIERLLLLSDAIISRVPRYRYVEALDQFCRFANSADRSPIPGSQLKEAWT
ncbi:hypothetical protein [Burkholderia territorii]|uniref:hypothetical protein n=1 Tax=Burkholderia territorii TaxID=1503055 RepID=UPI0007588493|nr:hypothetical protein [Burkholderia territorii]KWA08219.1 hypothetical protein WT37_26580 [Burkholderia territorii]